MAATYLIDVISGKSRTPAYIKIDLIQLKLRTLSSRFIERKSTWQIEAALEKVQVGAGSKNRATADIKKGLSGLAKNHTVEALGVIVELMHNNMSDNVRL
ncbi:hypothetical protein OAB29_01070 [Oceanospirillaceae bacterium]|nr:hypothetical protein [Oceanospirillaceae bacterium]